LAIPHHTKIRIFNTSVISVISAINEIKVIKCLNDISDIKHNKSHKAYKEYNLVGLSLRFESHIPQDVVDQMNNILVQK
jgi:hypothetical protein